MKIKQVRPILLVSYSDINKNFEVKTLNWV